MTEQHAWLFFWFMTISVLVILGIYSSVSAAFNVCDQSMSLLCLAIPMTTLWDGMIFGLEDLHCV